VLTGIPTDAGFYFPAKARSSLRSQIQKSARQFQRKMQKTMSNRRDTATTRRERASMGLAARPSS